MEPFSSSTTNPTIHEDQHKNTTPSTHHQPLVVVNSCNSKPHQDQNSLNRPFAIDHDQASSLKKNAARDKVKDPGNESGSEKTEATIAGIVEIPERWGQEGLLKDWIEYSTFDELLAPKEAGQAREALVSECRKLRL